MITSKMTLREMIDFIPSEEDMLSLPIEDVVYIKISIISLNKDDNYSFIRFLFSDEEANNFFNNISSTIFYDFDGTNKNQEKYITIFDLTSKCIFQETSMYLEELLNRYTHEANVIIDLFTHDNKKWRLSNLEEIVKLEEITK